MMNTVQRVLLYVLVCLLGIGPLTLAMLVLYSLQKAQQGIQLLGLD